MSGELTFSLTPTEQFSTLSAGSPASPNSTTTPKDDPNASAPNAVVSRGSASSQRLQHLGREINTTLEKYAEYAGVTLRPARGPTGWSINANVLISKLAEIAVYHPEAADVLKNLKQDLAFLGKEANMNFNVRDDKGVPLNHGNKAFDPLLAKAVQEMYRNEKGEQLWGNDQLTAAKKPTSGESHSGGHELKPPVHNNKNNADLPVLKKNQTADGGTSQSTPPANSSAGEPLW